MLIFQGSFSGAWLTFVGWFILQAAKAEARYVATEQALGGLRVRNLMVRHPITVAAESTIGRFMDDVAWTHRFTTYPVLEGGRPVGLLALASVAGSPPRVGYAIRAGHNDLARLGTAAHRGPAGRGGPGGAFRAEDESGS